LGTSGMRVKARGRKSPTNKDAAGEELSARNPAHLWPKTAGESRDSYK
jgi:hypothetical protein